MTDASRARWKLLLAFAIVYIVWGSTYLGIRFAIVTIPPLLMAGVRFLIAGLLLFGWSQWKALERPKLVHWRTAVILGLLMLFAGNGGVTLAEKSISSGLAALLVASEPLWLVLLSWARPGGTAPSKSQIGGLLLGFAGVGLLVTPTGGSNDLMGSLFVIGAAFAWAAGSIYSTTAESVNSAPVGNGMIMLCGGVALIIAGLIHGEARQLHPLSVSTSSAVALAYLIVFGSLAAFSAYTYLLSHTTAAKASSYAFVNPVIAVLLGWGISGEELTWRSLVAMVVILLAVFLLTRKHVPTTAQSAAYAHEEAEQLRVA